MSSSEAPVAKLWLKGHSVDEIVVGTRYRRDTVERVVKDLEAMQRVLPKPLTDQELLNRVRAWALLHGTPCTPRRWTDTGGIDGVAASMLIARFGSWAKAMRQAGVPYNRAV